MAVATVVAAAESTGNVSSSQHVRDVADRLRYLDPEAAPFTLLLDAESSEAAQAKKIEWAEKGGDFYGNGFAPKWLNINNGGGYTTGDTTFTVDDGAGTAGAGLYVKPNDLIKVVRTGEILHATSGASTSIVVSRAVGSISATALVDNDDLVVIGSTWGENADVGTPTTFQEAWKFNYTQIFRTVCGASRTQSQVKNYLGDERTRLRREAAVEHRIDLERAFLYGERNEQTTGIGSTSSPKRETGGYFYWGTQNITDANGTLTEPEVWAHCAAIFAHTAAGNTRTMFASSTVCSVIDLLAGARLQTVPKDETYGIAINQWVTSHGTLNIIKHRLLETGFNSNAPSGQFATATLGYGGFAITVNIPSLKYRPLQTTQLLTDRQAPGVDGWKDEYLTECGLEFANPYLHGAIIDVSG